MGFLDDYALIGNEAIEKILLTPRTGVMPRVFPRWGNDAPALVRELGLQPYGALKLFFRRPEGVHRASGKPRASIGMRQFCHENFPCGGLTRRLRRGSGTCRPMGRSHFSFDGERKVCKRKPAARHYGKKAFIAHFDGGARNVARNGVR